MFFVNVGFAAMLFFEMLETDRVMIGWGAVALVSISIVKNVSIAVYFICKQIASKCKRRKEIKQERRVEERKAEDKGRYLILNINEHK